MRRWATRWWRCSSSRSNSLSFSSSLCSCSWSGGAAICSSSPSMDASSSRAKRSARLSARRELPWSSSLAP
ncbi:hypothetical protein PF005_g12329 [Phytophthora fragariae]|uniref:Uncharacterized protein n=1 Tax=Phytophthora fragariae TaxID=53985 RepID=A0A6A3Y268_9STRA|nr:hypothetical protein PF003_g15700 [Phytophthora fragariae]KAE8936846.1 hypothetical protein PF009_g13235 [Phytophthora fragariae]KAE8979120.1 hypothetical protein PF011_g22978 [Phytophthora fragariae]KAE9108549.1 hypothetical protein PF007_g12615 [Phytophthora fragariae]KAE9145647.1 hypothetical protein PF006_g9518 [Phytophthora fragariae]